MPSDFKISKPILISSSGSAANEIRMVSPMPSSSSPPKAMADLTVPVRYTPASVTPKCKGLSTCAEINRYASMVKNTLLALTEILNWSKLLRSKISIWRIADSSIASPVGSPYFFWMSFSSDPAFTPIRILMPWCLAAAITSRTFCSLPILPGLIRKQSAPASATASAIL